MVVYTENGDRAIFNGVLFRRDKQTGYFLSSWQIDGKRKRLHVAVWESVYGTIEGGAHIHHKDLNKNNNTVENLCVLTGEAHIKYHSQNMSDDHKQKLTKSLLEKAVPKAAEWHRSTEGRAWHKEHAKTVWNGRKPQQYVCSFCGQSFESLKAYADTSNKFCSNNCKSAFRRKSNKDNESRVCE